MQLLQHHKLMQMSMFFLIGNNCGDVAKSLSEMSAVKKVLQAEAAHYENYLAENFAPLVVKVSENYSHISKFSKYIW